MTRVLLLQLPIPQLNQGRQTGNIPLAGALLQQAAAGLSGFEVATLPESLTAYLGDAALLDLVLAHGADVVGFTVFCWNLDRSLFLARELKKRSAPFIIFGGPEVSPDNPRVRSPFVDFLVFGEGEVIFPRLLSDPLFRKVQSASVPADEVFRDSPSPYPAGLLEPEIENMMLLETQRGCPYRCGYCYYPKSRDRIALKDESWLLEAVKWAADREIPELYLLDPSLNARPRLGDFLVKVREINQDRRLGLISEIRAEAIDAPLAGLLAETGFTWFEIGLQSTNPRALEIMNRPLDAPKFLNGINLLKKNGIVPRIDLIAGLPGDDLDGFIRSVDFVAANDLQDDIQVFPLSVLPGTDFRRRAGQLGLEYSPDPPYLATGTPTFPRPHIFLAFEYAEYKLDVAFHPPPHLDPAWRTVNPASGPDHWVDLGGREFVAKVILESERPLSDLEVLSRRLTHPYQVFLGPRAADHVYVGRVLEILTSANPMTPLEVIFLEPPRSPRTEKLLSRIKIARPHFLDVEHQYQDSGPGDRTVMFTLISENPRRRFEGPMRRRVFWLRGGTFPTPGDLKKWSDLDGVLIDIDQPLPAALAWQAQTAPRADEIPDLCFPETRLQNNWLLLTKPEDFYFGARGFAPAP
ncbi:MAG: B12-binding domain-containing radical SAM protein [Pseudomonadota bacterium]